MTKKVSLNERESEKILPIIREFNKITAAVSALMDKRVKIKERKVSILISEIKRPDQNKGQIRVKSVEFTKSFLDKQRKKGKKKDQSSDWNDNFSERRGFVI